MSHKDLSGKAQTVLGPIDADGLGVTLMHEHLFIDLSSNFVEPDDPVEKKLAHEPVQISNLYRIKQQPFSNLDNLSLLEEQQTINETMFFKAAGGSTIVEVTPKGGLGRNPLGLVNVARETGLNVIMGTGFYMGALHPPELADMTEKDITEGLIKELTIGVGDTGICAGIIGEIGCSKPIEKAEKCVLRCCAVAQHWTGAAIYLHPSPDNDLVLENVRILDEAGADLSRVIVGHIDIHDFDKTTCHKLMEMGCYIGFDSFGLEGFMKLPNDGGYIEPNDMNRLNRIINFVDDGYLDHILLSNDVGTKERLVAYGGYGYGHVLRDIVPIMRIKGLSDEQIYTLLMENPKRILPFAPVND
jgi:phosphotriesterase-related protein